HAATKALLERNDVLVVASVSCIYGLGSPARYFDMLVLLERGAEVERDAMLRKLVDMQYQRNDLDFHRGTFRVRGDVVEVFPAHEEARAIRVELFGDTVESLLEIDPLRGKALRQLERVAIYPASHYVATDDVLKRAVTSIRTELQGRLNELRDQQKLLEAQRLEQRTQYDLELLAEMGFCPGIENYSRHLDGRAPGDPPYTLLDYFPDDCLLVIDESHVTVPQIGGMYRGDRSRKETLVEFGFRLPSALDNRPLNFEEFLTRVPQAVYVSATPGEWELQRARGRVVEQLIRPTGLTDPEVIVRPARHQVDDLREGLDLPEVSLVAILDADKEGYLRSERSLIQTIGRAARNVHGTVLMYADAVTASMRRAIDETDRRRAVQQEYNERHGITPQTIQKAIAEPLAFVCEADYLTVPLVAETPDETPLDPAA